jgi:hypothetical protein
MEKLYQVIVDTQNDYDEVNDQVTFIDNHDMSRFMTLCGENRSAVNQAYVLLLTSRGIPTIYYGSEQYMTGSSDPYNRSDMTGFDTSTTAYQIISALAPLRKTNAALAYGDTVERWLNDDVLIYERQFGDDVVLTAVNRSFSVLTGSQIPTRFIVNNAETDYGTNIYLVGNIQELGNWDPDHAIGPFFNETESIASYPSWFYDVSLPASTNIEYKFIKKDSSGNVVWESGTNHTLTTVDSGTATEEVNWQD